MRKKCFSDRKKLLKFEAEGREFENFLRSLEQFIQTLKGQNNFGNKIPFPIPQNAFLLVPGGFSDLIHWNNYNSKWKK